MLADPTLARDAAIGIKCVLLEGGCPLQGVEKDALREALQNATSCGDERVALQARTALRILDENEAE
jgi:hypothetical protein